ncbi:hypothetical protein LCI18_012982 [Fusarium solani-melongenae]|uniref:Uncharacterized protein n=1 Tax=Fusarium solani subsp. cucurbitae TaxID=2747967 RepID=A0ACD3ZLE1_FUSSC|nr:hypothetical protein LCI18_012982 [Fusarium solani-melongenae]
MEATRIQEQPGDLWQSITWETKARSQLTATGFSKADIDALGNFPDYAALSGVRLPHPYPEFDIDKAKARPYRPVRWVYHQTMCK